MIASLRYDLNEHNTVRVSYSHDYGRHRQTGETGFLQLNGVPVDVFPSNNGIRDANGRVVQKRDRLSFAILDQVSGEYRGEFGGLTLNLGVRAPFFIRNLNNYCFTTSASGFVDCFGQGATAANTAYATANPGYAAPQSRHFAYNRVLPNVGLTYRPENSPFSVYATYSKGLQVPGTDNLYQDFFYANNSSQARPDPETTDNFDVGVRYTTPHIQAFVGPWYTRFTNRLASAFDVDSGTTVYRNLGRVDKYGIDGSIAYSPIRQLTAYVFGSYLHSEIKNNVLLGSCPAVIGAVTTPNCTVGGAPIYALTAGRRESGAPVYTFGGRLQGDLGPVELGIQAKRTGRRYLNDQNLPALACTGSLVNQVCPTTATSYQVYGAYAPGYTQVDLDARISMAWAGLNNRTYLQVNVENLFNNFYVGGFSGGSTTQYSIPFAQVSYPRTVIATLNVEF